MTLALLVTTDRIQAQDSSSTTSPYASTVAPDQPDRQLPDMSKLMHQVEEHQKLAEAIEKNYIYNAVVTEQELDGHNHVKKTTVEEFEFFWIDAY